MESTKGAILIIDDEEGIRCVLEAILSSIDFETFEAGDARTAIRLLTERKDQIGACLLDMNLDDSSGEHLYDKLRSISPEVAIFAMSGIYSDEIRERLGDRDIAGVISKPFNASELISVIQAGLGQRS